MSGLVLLAFGIALVVAMSAYGVELVLQRRLSTPEERLLASSEYEKAFDD